MVKYRRTSSGTEIVIKRIYVHNFRCFENFEFKVDEIPSALLIGKNGSGKSTLAASLRIFQSIGRGVNRVGSLVSAKDFSCGRSAVPMRLELEVILEGKVFKYSLALELPEKFKELRVFEETLEVDGKTNYSRQQAQVTLSKQHLTQFLVDWHLIALPIIQESSATDPIHIFKSWLANMIILTPIPNNISGNSSEETLRPNADGSNLGDWLSGLLGQYPAAYSTIHDYLQSVMPDLKEFRNEPVGKDAKRLLGIFASGNARFSISLEDLSDGEKCFFLCAVILSANKHYGPLFCFWDEPDNYLSLSEVGHFIVNLRRAFSDGGQLIITSHNEEAIRRFSVDNTWVLDRKNHLEPTLIRLLGEMQAQEDLIQALISGEVSL